MTQIFLELDELFMWVCEPRETYQDVYRDVDGLYCGVFFTEKNIRSAMSYSPRVGDVLIVSYPKCGTTWIQHIVCNIFHDGAPPGTFLDIMRLTPFLEVVGAEGVPATSQPGTIKTHLPFNKHRYSVKAKYIYITRNPYDCCVSYYYHTKLFPAYCFKEGTFEQFFQMFVEGKVDFGDYFEHVLSWYNYRNENNVLFVTYEQLKKDTPGMVLKIADFLGKEQYGDKLRQRPEILAKILNATSIESMRKLNPSVAKQLASTFPDPEHVVRGASRSLAKKTTQGDFVRKGIVGDWRDHFSLEKVARMKERIALKTAGTDVMELWKDVGLP
ncbi:sulfotransferase ssu-1-like [Haemaphysalis longicornis]